MVTLVPLALRWSRPYPAERSWLSELAWLRIDVYRPAMLLDDDVATNGKAARRRMQLFGRQMSALGH